jgi:hypothetical protein
MRGSVVKRGNGYSVVVELDRDPITNKRRQKWHSGYRTKKDAERALTELLAAKDSGTYLEITKQTFGGFIPEWLAAIKPTIRPSTHHSYRRNLQLHVLPHLESVQLRRIDAGMLNGLYAALLAEGRKNYGGAQELRRGRVIASQRSIRPRDHPQSTQGCCEVGEVGPKPCRRCRST